MTILDETWEFDGHDILTGPAEDCEWSTRIRHVSWGPGDTEARGLLAAQSPTMARLLVAFEWSGHRGWGPRCCPACEQFKPGDYKDTLGFKALAGDTCGGVGFGHLKDCELVAVLVKAGVWEGAK